jgi:hypothetical protein
MSLRLSESVTWKNLGTSMVLLNLLDSTYYVLNETASLAVRGILDGKTYQQITESIVDEYDCSADEAVADAKEAFDYMLKEGLLHQAE